jgi:TPR repeat protein
LTERVAVVFIHGLFSSARTWSAFNVLMRDDPALAGFDRFEFEYWSPVYRFSPVRRIPNYTAIADTLLTFLETKTADYRKIVLVTHSQGGLIVQQYLARRLGGGHGEQLRRIRLIVMYACPNSGSQALLALRKYTKFWVHPQERALRPFNDEIHQTRRIVHLQVVNATATTSSTAPIPIAVYAGNMDGIVPLASAQDLFPDAAALPGDHFTIIKPDSPDHLSFLALRRHLLQLVEPQRNEADQAPARTGRSRPARLGRPISECDPFQLEVRRAITLPSLDAATPVLPLYVRRTHDTQLGGVVAEVVAGAGRMVVLVGGPAAGKTRACWEAIRSLPDTWWVWQPIEPGAAAAVGEVGSHTVVWLNDAQHYLLTTDPRTGERVAAGLRRLLADPARAPVLVLATVWPEDWWRLTSRPAAGGPDLYAQARELLSGADIRVPEAFTDADLQALHAAAAGDPRLRHAAEHAQGGKITQYLAGAPELEARYRNAGPVARAVIDVAIDARRLGHPVQIPHGMLERAVPGYLDDHDWNQAAQDWLEQAVAYAGTPCQGVPGPLTRIRPRPGQPPTADGQPWYRLSDILEATGRAERAAVFPPAGFWEAIAATVSDPHVLYGLGRAAENRGRYSRAAQLYQQAADHGHPGAPIFLLELRARAGDPIDIGALQRQVADRADIAALRAQAQTHARAGDLTRAEDRAARSADYGDDVGASMVFANMARVRERVGDRAGAETLVFNAAGRGHTIALMALAGLREGTGDRAGAEDLALRGADRGHTNALITLAWLREWRGDPAGAEDLAMRGAEHGHPVALIALAGLRDRLGDPAGAEALLMNAAEHGHADAVLLHAVMRVLAGDPAGGETLLQTAADHGHADVLPSPAWLQEWASDLSGLEAVMVQEANRGSANGALPELAELRELAGDHIAAYRIRHYGLTDSGAAATSLQGDD